jgi:hypothetical protein
MDTLLINMGVNGRSSVDSKLTCPVYVVHDLPGSSSRVFQPRAEIVARTVGLGSTRVPFVTCVNIMEPVWILRDLSAQALIPHRVVLGQPIMQCAEGAL